jgi:hypothetical protein
LAILQVYLPSASADGSVDGLSLWTLVPFLNFSLLKGNELKTTSKEFALHNALDKILKMFKIIRYISHSGTKKQYWNLFAQNQT